MKKTMMMLLGAAILVSGIYFGLLMAFLKPEAVKEEVVLAVEEITASQFKFDGFELNYFPFPEITFNNVECSASEWSADMAAESLKLRLSPLAFLWGTRAVSKLEVRQGSLSFSRRGLKQETISLKHLFVTAKPFRMNLPVKLEFRGVVDDDEGSVRGKVIVAIQRGAGWDWSRLSMDGGISVEQLSAKKLLALAGGRDLADIAEGRVSADIEIAKKQGNDPVSVMGQASVSGLIYRVKSERGLIVSPPIKTALEFGVSWDLQAEELRVEEGVLTTPIGTFAGDGNILMRTKEIQDMRIMASDIPLEALPQYLVPFKEAIPFNIGFSGKSSLEMSLSGTLDHLSIHANWDLTESLLTYARYFSKRKDIPLNFSFSYLLRDGEILSGNFSMRLKEVNMKGNLTDLNLKTGDGQVNVITNKFKLNGWEDLLPPIQQYKVSGDLKLLVNLKGNLLKLYDTETMFNLSLENGDIRAPSGEGIGNANMYIDYGQVGLEVKNAKLEINDDPVFGEVIVYGLFDDPMIQVSIRSPEFAPRETYETIRRLVDEWLPEDANEPLDQAQSWVRSMFPPHEKVEGFVLGMKIEDGKVLLNELELQAYGGQMRVTGELNDQKKYTAQVGVDRLSLAKYLSRGRSRADLVDGSLFLKADLWGEGLKSRDWIKGLNGEGSFLITNGEFYTFDLLDAVGKINNFESVATHSTGSTPFNDLTTSFFVKDGKVITEEVTLLSHDASLTGNGEFSLDGKLNYRLDVFVLSGLIESLSGIKAGKTPAVDERFFGPVPLLLSGPLSSPVLKSDSSLVSQLFEKLVKEKSYKVLRNFPAEEVFFERRLSS